MRKKKPYLFLGRKELAYSKDEILRAHNLPCSPKNYARIAKVKQSKGEL